MIGIICMSVYSTSCTNTQLLIIYYIRINSHFVHCFSHVWADAGHRFTKSKHSFWLSISMMALAFYHETQTTSEHKNLRMTFSMSVLWLHYNFYYTPDPIKKIHADN